MQPLQRWQVISDGDEGPRQQGANLASRAATGGKGHGVQSRRCRSVKIRRRSDDRIQTFKSPEGREMVQCTWFDKKPREHRAAFVMDSLEVAEATTPRLRQGERA